MRALHSFVFVTCAMIFALLCGQNAFAQCQPEKSPGKNTDQNATLHAKTACVDTKDPVFPLLPDSLMNAEYQTLDGHPDKLADHKGRVVLMNLWAIWCTPCRDEMPHLQQLSDKYKDKRFEVIGINIGNFDREPESPKKITGFAEQFGITYSLGQSTQTFFQEFVRVTQPKSPDVGLGSIPQTILIDRNGRLRGVYFGGSQRTVEIIASGLAKVLDE